MVQDNQGEASTFLGERLRLPASISEVDDLRHRYADFLARLKLGPDSSGLWVLVLTEAVVNAIRHGCGNDSAKSIEVAWWVSGSTVNLEVTDPGQGPPASAAPYPVLPDDPLSPGGRGLFLIQGYVDQREEWRGTGGYRLLLSKKHPEITGASDSDESIMEQTLMELSACYESMAAFYRLGEGLAEAESVTHFIRHAMDDLAKATPHDSAWLAFAGAAAEVIGNEGLGTSYIITMDGMTHAEREVFQKDRELVWDAQSANSEPAPLPEFQTGVCCPIHAGGQPRGLITLVRRDGPGFSAGELKTLRTFADIFGIAVLNAANTTARRREALALRELEIASELQNKLLPLPTITAGPGWRVTTRRESARQVSGDHVEIAHCRNGDTILAMVDVMGKGVPAAFLAAIFRTALHITLTFQYSLAGLMLTLNRNLSAQLGDLTMFATCALVRIPETADSAEVVNAGHCPILLVSPDGKSRQISPDAPPLGLFPDADYLARTLKISPGDKLFLVTDGLYEWQNGEDIWGWENLRDFLKNNRRLPGETIWQILQKKILVTQTGEDENRDDRTFLCWERNSS